jgi:hypothetical protein
MYIYTCTNTYPLYLITYIYNNYIHQSIMLIWTILHPDFKTYIHLNGNIGTYRMCFASSTDDDVIITLYYVFLTCSLWAIDFRQKINSWKQSTLLIRVNLDIFITIRSSSVPITTNVVSWNLVQASFTRYNIMW